MKIITNPKQSEWAELLKRPTQTVENIENTVVSIFNDVQQKGDLAISKYTSLFDGVNLDTILVTKAEIE